MEPIIELKNVTKSFVAWEDRPNSLKKILAQATHGRILTGKRHPYQVLSDVSFKIFPGEFVGIMGRNGAGKSTIMKMIAGIYTPNSGTIEINGKVAPLLELGAGFADELSGLDNIYLNASILGYSRRRVEEVLRSIVEFSELGEHLHAPVRKYSSGMLVRLGFSIAAHLDAPILLFDEILAVGDAGFQKKCLAKIEELHNAGRSIILITHSPDAVRRFCSRCIVLNNHKVTFDGPANEGAAIYDSLFL
jgi:ABC-type polysaccharide/polyol phosphate transport system ATPase subunit